jgi:hypothetical protein
MRQTKRLLSTSVSPISIGLCRLSSLPAAKWPFPTLSLPIFLYVQGPLPRLLLWCAHPFLPTRLRPSQRCHPVGALADIHALAISAWATFRGCSHSIIFRPVDLLATQVAPTVTPSGVRQPWLLRPRLSQFVTSLSRGYANRLNRVIGGRGTSTLLDSQPCRLLRHPSRRFALACHDSLLCPGRPASVPLRHTIAGSVLATQHSRKWLDGVSDALAYALRRLGTCRPQPTTGIRPRRRLPGTPRLRFALHGAQRNTRSGIK